MMAEKMVEFKQLFAMKKQFNSLQLLRGPYGGFMIIAGDLTQPEDHQFIMGFWSKEDLRQLNKAITTAIADA